MKGKTGKHPTKLGTLASKVGEKEIVIFIIDKFKNYTGIISIKNELPATTELCVKAATVDQINKTIRSLNAKKKTTGADNVPLNFMKNI